MKTPISGLRQKQHRERQKQKLVDVERDIQAADSALATARSEEASLLVDALALDATLQYKEDIIGLLEHTNTVGSGSAIGAAATVLEDPEVVQELVAAHCRGLCSRPVHAELASSELASSELASSCGYQASVYELLESFRASGLERCFKVLPEEQEGHAATLMALVRGSLHRGELPVVHPENTRRVAESFNGAAMAPQRPILTWMVRLADLATNPLVARPLESILAACCVYRVKLGQLLLQMRPNTVVNFMAHGSMLPPGLPAETAAMGLPPGVNPLLLPLRRIVLSDQQRSDIVGAWERYQEDVQKLIWKQGEARARLASLHQGGAGDLAQPLALKDSQAATLGATEVANALSEYCVAEIAACARLGLDVLEVLSPRQAMQVYSAAHPYLLDPVQVTQMLLEGSQESRELGRIQDKD